VKQLEHDIIGSQGRGYKRLKKLQLGATDQKHTNLMPKEYWNASLSNAATKWEGGKEMA
jgi:hypothetical protein